MDNNGALASAQAQTYEINPLWEREPVLTDIACFAQSVTKCLLVADSFEPFRVQEFRARLLFTSFWSLCGLRFWAGG